MVTTKEILSKWFDTGVEDGQDYMIIICDTFDHSDYPVYCLRNDFTAVYDLHYGSPMQRVMEVYDLHLEKALQLEEYRAKHFPPEY